MPVRCSPSDTRGPPPGTTRGGRPRSCIRSGLAASPTATGTESATWRGSSRGWGYLAALGVDVLWLSPISPSPQDDAGYDVSDYQDIDSTFGSLGQFDSLLTAVHERGMRLVIDLVVNHTSDEHPWFVDPKRQSSDMQPRPRPGPPSCDAANEGRPDCCYATA
jgi:glycosidase